ncbi:SRPBCC family protein [Variovorax humicola]|uniref:SRPBCC family protein n=1 Tax=Variovorax humicola TaxID=1769758 RepID=A0ABU8VV45_9BURK
MEIEKTLTVAADPQRVWALLLDPQVMGGCVPGMKSIDVVSDVEYVAVMHVKIAFINAKFKLRTTIVEQRAPSYLRTEGTGEDASVASSLKQQSEIFLTPTADGGTELRIKVQVDVLGRLGTFGLSVMKTKADRMWEEFGANLAARIDGGVAVPAVTAGTAVTTVPAVPAVAAVTVAAGAATPAGAAIIAVPAPAPSAMPAPSAAAALSTAPAKGSMPTAAPTSSERVVPARAATPRQVEATLPDASPGWWSRLTGARSGSGANVAANGRFIHIEVRQLDKTISIDWPLESADQCKAWLRELVQ